MQQHRNLYLSNLTKLTDQRDSNQEGSESTARAFIGMMLLILIVILLGLLGTFWFRVQQRGSYSGQCYFSYANGGRSANRGECAQPCRKKYSLIDEKGKVILKDKYLLSLKDFNASDSIEKLISCGVKSFKIEGRLKDINYVKNVVAYYNDLLNKYAQRTSSGKIFLDFEPDTDKTFNRGYFRIKNRAIMLYHIFDGI